MVAIARILCPVDFSPFSQDALHHAAALARRYDALVTVLHVYAIPPAPIPVAGAPFDAAMTPPLVNPSEIEAQTRQFATDALGDRAVRLEVRILPGNPSAEIARLAEQLPADLLVLGTHGRGGFERLFLGSVTEKLLRSTRVPVLTVPPPVTRPETVEYQRILCPIDFSDESLCALEYALSLAQETDARLLLLHVLEGFVDEPDLADFADLSVMDYYQRLEADASRRLRALIPADARDWAHPAPLVAKGKAYRQILRVATADRAQIIVMGVRGRGAIDRMIFGSTTHHVIREARCPVLTLHR